MHKQQGWLQAWEYSQAKLIQTLGRASQGVDWSWSQCIKSHHAQTSSGKGLPSHFWTRDNVRSVLPGLWRKRTQWSKVLFCFHASFCWQALWRCGFHFPAGLGTCPQCQRYQKLDQKPCLCALNLFNTRVSQFELNYWNKWTFPRHSNLLRCTCN